MVAWDTSRFFQLVMKFTRYIKATMAFVLV